MINSSSDKNNLFVAAVTGLGVIAIGTLLIEITTGGHLAAMSPFGLPYLSLPPGVGVTFLALVGLFRNNLKTGVVGSVLGLFYWLILIVIG